MPKPAPPPKPSSKWAPGRWSSRAATAAVRPPSLFYDGSRFREYTTERIPSVNTHGTGCTFASAVAAGLAHGLEVPAAVGQAKEYVTAAIRAAYPIGRGHGPLHHFHSLWP